MYLILKITINSALKKNPLPDQFKSYYFMTVNVAARNWHEEKSGSLHGYT